MIEQKKNFRVLEKLVEGDKVVFVFTAMGTKIGLYNLFIKRLNRIGYSVVIYDYPLQVLWEADLNEWMKFYEEIIADAQSKIEKYKMKGAKHFYTYGVSMGTLIANKFARDTAAISHVILNMTYGDIADNIWSYKGVKKAKQSLVRQGIDIGGLRTGLSFVDPIVNAADLKGKKVLLHLARRDRILVYEQTRETKRALERAGIDLQYVESKYLGHWAAGAKQMLNIKQIADFYAS